MSKSIEYRVRPVTRYVVTRFEAETTPNGGSCGSEERGEFDNQNIAYDVARALAELERQRLGYSLDDPRIKFPYFSDCAVNNGPALRVGSCTCGEAPLP